MIYGNAAIRAWGRNKRGEEKAEIRMRVIQEFLENEEAAFSLFKIFEKGLELFKSIAVDWCFGTNSISQVLKTLQNE